MLNANLRSQAPSTKINSETRCQIMRRFDLHFGDQGLILSIGGANTGPKTAPSGSANKQADVVPKKYRSRREH